MTCTCGRWRLANNCESMVQKIYEKVLLQSANYSCALLLDKYTLVSPLDSCLQRNMNQDKLWPTETCVDIFPGKPEWLTCVLCALLFKISVLHEVVEIVGPIEYKGSSILIVESGKFWQSFRKNAKILFLTIRFCP